MSSFPCPTSQSTTPPFCNESSGKRRRLEATRDPLQNVVPNLASKPIGPFIFDGSDDEQVPNLELLQRQPQSLSKHPIALEYTPQLMDTSFVGASSFLQEEEEQRLQHQPTQVLELSNGKRSSDSIDKKYRNSKCLSLRWPPPCSTSVLNARTCSGQSLAIERRKRLPGATYEQIIAARSSAAFGRGCKSYYGVDIHSLVEGHSENEVRGSRDTTSLVGKAVQEITDESNNPKSTTTLLWTEKYRARRFIDLVGDERTHRSVLGWLKAWDPIVFPGLKHPKVKQWQGQDGAQPQRRAPRKVLLLTGPPGLGKTTLAHVCAKQAGYEVQEINASDERSRDVVTGRIRDMVATENVRQVNTGVNGAGKRMSRPVCVIIDEVDGVVTGSSGNGGEGGFIKALADLVALDAHNSAEEARRNTDRKRRKKGDGFRILRPLILICNDVFHPSLRLLRQGMTAEVIYVRKPPISMVVPRLQAIFCTEGVPCDSDGVRQLCKAAWGIGSRKGDNSANDSNDGDIRGLLVIGEWVATKLRISGNESRLTKRWVEHHMQSDLAYDGEGARFINRGGSKEITDRVFSHHAGFSVEKDALRHVASTSGIAASKAVKRGPVERLRDLIDNSGEQDRVLSDCFSTFPSVPFQDDTFLTKPCAAYEWLDFHDRMSHLVHRNQEWELSSYLSSSILAFHHLFASSSQQNYSRATDFKKLNGPGGENIELLAPFSSPRASWEATEIQKANNATLQHLQGQLSLPLRRAFRSTDEMSTELLPYLLRMLNPDVKPVVVGGSENGVVSVRRGPEKDMIARAVDAMIACGVSFEKSRVDSSENTMGIIGGMIYRMVPGLDILGVFETAGKGLEAQRVRFAVRQVLEQELRREKLNREQQAGLRRVRGAYGGTQSVAVIAGSEAVGLQAPADRCNVVADVPGARKAEGMVNRDFFGRVIVQMDSVGHGVNLGAAVEPTCYQTMKTSGEGKIWIGFREGYSTAVRKPLTLQEVLEGL